MVILWALLAIFCLRFIACHASTPVQKRTQVEDAMYDFLSTVGEKAIKMFAEHHIRTNTEQSDCFTTPGGRLMRSRCCVFYSTIAASLLYVRFDTTSSFDFKKLDAKMVDWLMRLWALQNDERDGIYSLEMEINGVKGSLIRCEFLEVHTYLLFVSPEIDKDILVDVSFKQFLVYPEFITDQQDYYKLAMITKDVDPVFVGPKDEFLEIFSAVKMYSFTMDLLGDKCPTFVAFLEVYKNMQLLYSDWAKENVCGKATSKYQGKNIGKTKDQL